MDKYEVLVMAASLIMLWPTVDQMSPNTSKDIPQLAKKAAWVQISEGRSLEIFRNNEAIIRWTSNKPGGTDEHWGVVKYGTDPDYLNLTAKGHVRLNQSHSYIVFRARAEGLQPHTTARIFVGRSFS